MLNDNKTKFYLWNFFKTITFYSPIITIYYKSNALSFTNMMLLQTCYTAIVLIFNIPTSVWSDMYSRKKLMVIATLLNAFGFALYGLGNTFTVFIIAEIFLGLSSALLGGVNQAYFYEMLNSKEKKCSTKYFSNIIFSSMIAGVIGNSLGGVIGSKIGIKYTFFASVVSTLIGFLIVCSLKPDNPQKVDINIEKSYKLYIKKIIIGFKELIKNKMLLYLIVQTSIIFQLYRISFFYMQQKFVSIGIEIAYIGIIIAIFNVLSAISVKLVNLIDIKSTPWNILQYIGAVIGVLFISINISNNIYFIIIVFLLINILIAIINPLFSAHANRLIKDAHRATILSFVGVFSSFIFMVLSPILGYIADISKINILFFLIGAIIVIDILIFKIININSSID